ncbi:MAG: type B 50S ribosomal protein L31 [Candidatus Shikimatogenerans sp. JK-2022]|nr:type B 50S ribosomal protein L31 [Candidatus Shikimatogenerans bostrichidophilus]
MKKNKNLNYRLVAFKDENNNKVFLIKSTINTKKKIIINNKEYPFYKLDISKYSHPFYTKNLQNTKKTGRIEKFKKKYKNFYK